MDTKNTKADVRNFYNQVGWQMIGEGVYQNAQFEDLRPVSRRYIHRCHIRVQRHLNPSGKYLLDAGSGPIQYPEYLKYSEGYRFRVCLDISIIALFEARKRIGSDHGLFVVADVANLPFKKDIFDGIVSLHTLHHLPAEDYLPAYKNLKRVLRSGSAAVVVNGWGYSAFMRICNRPIRFMEKMLNMEKHPSGDKEENEDKMHKSPERTHVHKLDAQGLRSLLGKDFPISILVWRSVSVRFLRAMVQPFLGGRFWLWILFGLEELFPQFFGEQGQYPIITFSK